MKTLTVAIWLGLVAFLGAAIERNETIQISIQGVPQGEQFRLNSTYQVSAQGTITMWEIGKVRAAGRTPSELAAAIAAAYKAKGIYTSPTFQVLQPKTQNKVQEQVTVGGFVKSPGPKPYRDKMTLFEAVTAAGGENAFGAANRVKLYRNAKVYTYDMRKADHKRVVLYPGDAIEVPEKNWIGQ